MTAEVETKSQTYISLHKVKNPPRDKDGRVLPGKLFRPMEMIPSTDIIYEDGEQREIQYVPGEKSIYKGKQSAGAKPQREPILLVNGLLTVRDMETTLNEYLKKSNYNEATEPRMPNKSPIFRIYDKEKDMNAFLEKETVEIDLRYKIVNMEAEELEALALALGDSNATKKKTSEVRRDLLVFAKQEPQRLLNELENPKNHIKIDVLRAVSNGILKINKQENSIRWNDDSLIVNVPIGKKAEDYLVDVCQTEKFKEVYAEIRKQLKKLEIVAAPKVSNPTGPVSDDVYIKNLMEKAQTTGRLKRHGMWFKLTSDPERKWQSPVKLLEDVKADDALRVELESD